MLNIVGFIVFAAAGFQSFKKACRSDLRATIVWGAVAWAGFIAVVFR